MRPMNVQTCRLNVQTCRRCKVGIEITATKLYIEDIRAKGSIVCLV